MYSSMIMSASSRGGGALPVMRPRARRSSTNVASVASSDRSSVWARQESRSASSVKQYAFHEIEKRSSFHGY